jgi:hypothetical protein
LPQFTTPAGYPEFRGLPHGEVAAIGNDGSALVRTPRQDRYEWSIEATKNRDEENISGWRVDGGDCFAVGNC